VGSNETFGADAWSSDGRWLAGYPPDISGISVYSFETRRLEQLADRGINVAWLDDGRRLLYQDEGHLFLLDRSARTSREVLAPSESSQFRGVSLSRDRRTLVLVRHQDEGDLWMLSLRLSEAER
jgi:hypothetical protein